MFDRRLLLLMQSLIVPALLAASCTQRPLAIAPAVPEQPTKDHAAPALRPAPTATPTPVPANTAVPTATVTETAVPAASPTANPSTPVASNTPDPYAAYTIEALAARAYGGGELQLVEQIESNDRFARYLISYPSDGLTIYGFMNVPHEGSKFPVAIVLHGYISPSEYETQDYTTRYADALAGAGYFVIHPNLRGFPPSDEGEDAFRTGLAVDVLNLIAILRVQSQDPLGPLRRADSEAIHLWGHSMGGGVVLRVATLLDAPYLRAAVLYGAMSGDEARNYERILEWSAGQSGDFELAAPPEALQAISPIHHLERIKVPLSIHHGDADETVPAQWSADLCALLQAREHLVECFTYNAAPHTFYGAWEDLFNERVISFFDRY